MATVALDGNPDNPTNGAVVGIEYDSLGNRVVEDSSVSPVVISRLWNELDQAAQIRLTDRGSPSNVPTFTRTFDDEGRLAKEFMNGTLIASLTHETGAGRIDYCTAGINSQPVFESRGRWVGLDVKKGASVLASQRDALGPDGVVRERQRAFDGQSVLTDFYQLDAAGRVVAENLRMPGITPRRS